jgi:hypothetical protein
MIESSGTFHNMSNLRRITMEIKRTQIEGYIELAKRIFHREGMV